MPSSAAKRMSSRSCSDSAGAEMPPPWRFRPLRSESSPPTRTRVSMLVLPDPDHVEHDLPVAQQQRVAGLYVARQVLVGDADALDGARLGIERGIEREGRALLQHDPPFAKALDADLRSRRGRAARRRICRRAARRRAPGPGGGADRRRVPCEALRRTTSTPARIICVSTARSSVAGPTVATIFARRSAACGPYQPRARSSSTATAGSVLPSTNSRNAPPPVEM